MADTSRARFINYGQFEAWASDFSTQNDDMQATLDKIMKEISNLNLSGSYESNAAEAIRTKIQGMKPRFDQYRQVVDNYVTFIRRTAQQWKSTEAGATNNANQFI
jgi:uncharacterized protein YukE